MRETQRNGRILQVFNGREPYDHVVQNIIIEFFLVTGEEAGYYYIHVRMLVMGSRRNLGYLWVILWDGMGSMALDWIVGLIPLWISHASLGWIVEDVDMRYMTSECAYDS